MTFSRWRCERGQVAIEFAGTAWLLVVAGLIAWQLALAGWTAVSASNAARTAARAYSKVGDTASAETDGRQSLQGDGFTSDTASVTVSGQTATAVAKLPILVPGLKWLEWPISLTESATMPPTH